MGVPLAPHARTFDRAFPTTVRDTPVRRVTRFGRSCRAMPQGAEAPRRRSGGVSRSLLLYLPVWDLRGSSGRGYERAQLAPLDAMPPGIPDRQATRHASSPVDRPRRPGLGWWSSGLAWTAAIP